MCPHSRTYQEALIAQNACPGCLIEENRMLRDRIDRIRDEHARDLMAAAERVELLTRELLRADLLRPRVIVIPKEMFDV